MPGNQASTDRKTQPVDRPRPAEIETDADPGPEAPRPEPETPVSQNAVSRKVVLEPFSRRLYDLSYACLVIPRFNHHRLSGDVVEFLRQTVYQICVSYGWTLDYILVRPEYLQWVISAPATTPPSRCIGTIRKLTSEKIFEDFPHYKQDNLGDDFWAPGYLLLVGSTPHPPEIIVDFIRLTRQRQGNLPRRGQ